MFNSLFQLFNVKAITDNVLQISENYYESWNKANMYLFRENGESILVDTGTGIFDPVKFLLEHGFINKKPKVNKYRVPHRETSETKWLSGKEGSRFF